MWPALFQAEAVPLKIRNIAQSAVDERFILSGGFPEAA
jgi:hypothetical protein